MFESEKTQIKKAFLLLLYYKRLLILAHFLCYVKPAERERERESNACSFFFFFLSPYLQFWVVVETIAICYF